MRTRLEAACHVIDVASLSDDGVASLARDLEIDIAVDLKGFTRGSRPGIFAQRAAPIQVNFLGYPGTMGTSFMDYLIADRRLIPAGNEHHYSEKIIYLPGSYQVNDSKRALGIRVFTRMELGLPPSDFVFCCFNNCFKITPGMFDIWTRILRRVEGSVLWLLEDNPHASSNLRQAAEFRGVRADRLVFAPRMPLAEHLARHRAADLFLDTLPCNAHTTASDALWAGLPVLTLLGESFAGRVAASLLTAIDLPDLITSTPEEYEALAIALAADPARLAGLRERVAQNRLTTPLFDTRRFTHHIEAAFASIHTRHQAGLAPADVVVQSNHGE
jgi:predicted O-linked N-acetylglucosamine transferase (SPINDLY family)